MSIEEAFEAMRETHDAIRLIEDMSKLFFFGTLDECDIEWQLPEQLRLGRDVSILYLTLVNNNEYTDGVFQAQLDALEAGVPLEDILA